MSGAVPSEEFARIYQEHAPRLRRQCWFLLGNEPDADDAVQETFSRMCRHLQDLRDTDRLGPWLRTVATREAQRILARRAAGPARAADAADLPAPAAVADPSGDPPPALLRALRALPERDRLLVHLRFSCGLTYPQIAAETEMTAAAAKMALHRTLERLRSAGEGARP